MRIESLARMKPGWPAYWMKRNNCIGQILSFQLARPAASIGRIQSLENEIGFSAAVVTRPHSVNGHY
jgi:hypothetical protein